MSDSHIRLRPNPPQLRVVVLGCGNGVVEQLSAMGHRAFSARSFRKAADLVEETAADLAILHLKPGSPEQHARQVRSLRMASSQCQVIVVADPPTLEMAQALMREGARGLLAAPIEGPTLRDAISGLCEEGLRGGSASAPLPVLDPEEVFAARHGLTARQTEVLNHLLQGQANKEVAAALSISLRTLEDHISRLLRKTRTKDVRLLLALHRSDTRRLLAAPGIPRVEDHDIARKDVEGSSCAGETQDASAQHRSVR